MENTTIQTAADRMRARWKMDEPTALVATKAPRRTGVGVTKQELCNAIARAAGVAAPTLKEGSTVPRSLFVRIIEMLDLPVDTTQSIVAMAEDIAYLGDQRWDSLSDSRAVKANNVSCVTIQGLVKVRNAIVQLHRTEV